MAFVAKYAIDNEGVYRKTKASNIYDLFKVLSRFKTEDNKSYFSGRSAVTVFTSRNLLLTSLLSSMVEAY